MTTENGNSNAALVIGAGIAGIKAALELAESGARVYLCDRQPHIGGTLVQLDKWFPDNHCGLCKILPVFDRNRIGQYCLRRGLLHPNIELLLLHQVKKVEGKPGRFSVTLKTEFPRVSPDLCTGCGICETVCPVPIDANINRGTGCHRAIFLHHPLALPKTYSIDAEHCTRCGACVDACPTRAISMSAPDEVLQLKVGAVIMSTGFENFDATAATQYGYRRYPNVITGLELERRLGGSGPFPGGLSRPSDGIIPRSIAFLQCVGCRDRKRDYCSSVCCMYAIKEATMIKEMYPDTDVNIFFMDLRAFGKGHHRYYDKARDELGIRFTRQRVPAVKQDFRTGDLLITTFDQSGELITSRFDMVVLSTGQTPSREFEETCHKLGVKTNRWGFAATRGFSAVDTTREGIFTCGTASTPQDIADTLVEATAAAGRAMGFLSSEKLSPITPSRLDEEEAGEAVILCNCYGQVGQTINLGKIADFCNQAPGVAYVEEVVHLCRPETWREVKARLSESGVNKAVIAACSLLPPPGLFEDTCIELINIREQLAWVHRDDGLKATEKAGRLVNMALEKIHGQESVPPPEGESVVPGALVIGGGLAGLAAARAIAERGFRVEVVEKSDSLGGNAGHVFSLLGGENPREYLENLIDEVKNHPRVRLRLNTGVVGVTGHIGNFKCTLNDKPSGPADIEAGAIIVATGAGESRPSEYLYGQAGQVITQRELEAGLASGRIDAAALRSVAMIQCVGSRDKDRPYCSRVCCSQALKNALTLKLLNPETEITVFYRDIMSYGFREEYYTRAREAGVLFVRYEPAQKPQVSLEGDVLEIKATDPVTGNVIMIRPDRLVLSPAIVPPDDNPVLARVLGIGLTEDGFFREMEAKFLPVDSPRAGIFLCGLASCPQDIRETITQAVAAAQRAAALLSRFRLTAGKDVSLVNERRCSGCELCIAACPYEARVKNVEKGVAQVIEALCQGCGACATACPNGAASLREVRDKQLFRILDAAI
ncbi:MAG: FAD-dependent oxidoreductase [Chloroflexota bacterium]